MTGVVAYVDHVDQVVTSLSEEIGLVAECEFRKTAGRWLRECRVAESPLEQIFIVAYAGATTVLALSGVSTYSLHPQHLIALPDKQQYRIDFAIVHLKVAVELDGHEFHEKTKEQVTARNRRDRDLQRHGWYVLHFSWSEVMSNPLGCALEVLNFAKDVEPPEGLSQPLSKS